MYIIWICELSNSVFEDILNAFVDGQGAIDAILCKFLGIIKRSDILFFLYWDILSNVISASVQQSLSIEFFIKGV